MTGAETAARLDQARSATGAVFAEAGFRPVEPAIFAPAETFLERLGERFRRQTCFFEDGTGEELCLRPEITIPVCRMALEGGFDGSQPLRLRYAGPVFRLTQDGAGALTQSMQAGAELLGAADPVAAEAEIIALALQALAASGVAEPQVVLGDAGAFADLVGGLDLTARQRARLSDLFDAYGSALVEHLPPEAEAATRTQALDLDIALAETEAELEARGLTLTGGRTAEDVARRIADRAGRAQARAIPQAARRAITEFFALAAPMAEAGAMLGGYFARVGVSSGAARRLASLAAALAGRGVDLGAVAFDASVHAPLGYYTGLEFRVDAAGRTVASGGRYDRLLGELAARDGWSAPAIGCALYLNEIAEPTP